MIKVSLIMTDGELRGIEVKGHAGSAPRGKDLICAGVSSIVTGGFNAFGDEDIESISLKEGYAKVNVCSPRGRVILDTIVVQLKTMAVSDPEFIEIKQIREGKK